MYLFNKKFPFFKQFDQMDCGPACLKMISKFYGKNSHIENIRLNSSLNKDGVSIFGISVAAEKLGFKSFAVKISFEKLKFEAPLPCIVHWDQNHFVVVYKIDKKYVYIADPSKDLLKYTYIDFNKFWITDKKEDTERGIALLLEPSNRFYTPDINEIPKENINYAITGVLNYLWGFKKLIFQIFLGILAGTLLQIIFPFLTKSIIDIGINTSNLSFIYLVLIGQIVLFAGKTVIDFIRSWILLHISTRLNVSIISDFLIKLMKLPISFFDAKMIGDIMQRIGDHHRIESFLTSTSLNLLFSLITLVVFGIILAFFNFKIFFIFISCSVIYLFWILIFLKRRKILDFHKFEYSSKNQSILVQLIYGIQEIKLNNCEISKRWEWDNIQAKLFKFNIRSLYLNQFQQTGAFFINETKNIFITFLAATSVINGELTLGGMLAILYIIGQLNSPVEQLVQFIQLAQDAKLSLNRLNEIHQLKDEDPDDVITNDILNSGDINIQSLSFSYDASNNTTVLKNINLNIESGKTTAIVGTSGSGKTTLLKLLLRYYSIKNGIIQIGGRDINTYSHSFWRSQCGVVMQDGFLFSDSIINNITIGRKEFDKEKFENAIDVSNLREFIDNLPLGYNTKIGAEGNGISQGQKQRILIARAVYKNPQYILFDEATNALDASNENIIQNKLSIFFQNRTAIIVAHRLSTVKNADKIIVLNNGEVVEIGNHKDLISNKRHYYDLVKNQLELEK